ncbi:photosynthetic complex assembly protein PuhC [Methylobacterium gossipiicola]|uniref:Putative photosynthetic complex assembly protein n=1 Tax=Methylobacterium gossipiicola TaxID=582675 RepID=A0A1I2V4W7_9HYPH|nr:photosynthetic complex assembly protein PuhC [Methylobacterium gossipiicola]SFG84388.1 putative photosynthetic complex assembly protein [Methylobacterium gossipiicola]
MTGRTLNAPFGRASWFPLGAGLLIAFVVGAIGFARHEGIGLTRMPPAQAIRTLRFSAEDRPDGAILLRDAERGTLIATLEPGQENFMRATLRGFGQARLRAGLGREAPFRLTHFDDGSLQLDDALTGRAVNLGAFGPSNFTAFARLLPEPGAAR